MLLSWIVFVVAFLAGKKPSSDSPDRKRDRSSIIGIVLQGFSYGICWSIRRAWFTPIFAGREIVNVGLSILAMLVAIVSVWFSVAAIRTLGQQWSLAARVLEGHKLVTQGPYSVVRNPIYTGMFGMLLATGLAVSHWIGLVLAIVVFAIGTFIRVRSEERLLREMFGREFDKYASTVPAVIPYLI
jgi:protein-S-isoprenylcysteine O-methyltransferase Ste14